jgi:malonyl-CoA O-methyltransferase
MLDAYESHRRDGKLPATYEVVFAQAWSPAGPIGQRDKPVRSEVTVPLSGLGRRRRS